MLTRTTHRVECLDTDADPFFAEERHDAPVTTPDDALSWAARCQGAVLALVIVCAVMAARYFFF